jgi:putative chitinase
VITSEQLSEAFECPLERAQKWCEPINAAMQEFDINTNERIAAFIAQIGHESGRLVWQREIWGPTASQRGYEFRHDLGNDSAGDGYTYRGRGLIQITGRANYRICGKALRLDLELHPELLEQPDIASRSSGWFWKTHGCNELADNGDFVAITKRINGGLNGQPERLALLESTTAALA